MVKKETLSTYHACTHLFHEQTRMLLNYILFFFLKPLPKEKLIKKEKKKKEQEKLTERAGKAMILCAEHSDG